MDQHNEKTAAGRQFSGIPLGGLGAGCVELGSDAFFRNITINNNRTPGTRIPVSEASFFALRIETETRTYARLLQRRLVSASAEGLAALPRLHPHEYEWQGVYPVAHYALKDPRCPATIAWGAFSPIIPFDLEASTLPAFFASVHCANSTGEPMRVSVAFNWENLCGRTATCLPMRPAAIVPLSIEEWEEAAALQGNRPLDEEKEVFHTLPCNALVFEMEDGEEENADGQHCLSVRYRPDDEVSVLSWDHGDAESCRMFWRVFSEQGRLMPFVPGERGETSGAVCVSFLLQPGEGRRIDYQLSWYCPRFQVHGVNLGNHYATRFSNAAEVARQTLRHYKYYFTSVEGWQNRLLTAHLPAWLRHLLINCNSVFSTNTLYTADGYFEVFASPEEAMPGRLGDRLYSTLGTLLFFPRLEENQLFRQVQGRLPGVAEGSVASLSPFVPKGDRNEVMETAQFVLSAYRNFIFTGSLAKIRALLPLMQRPLKSIMALDHDGDGLPEGLESAVTYDGVAVQGLDCLSAGLWVTALQALSRLMGMLKRGDKVEEFRQQAQKAAAAFEKGYWDEDRGFYRLARMDRGPQEPLCHPGQLGGAWYAEFLGLGRLFDPDHISRALDAIAARYPREGVLPAGVENAWLCPAYDSAHYAGLRIVRGGCLDGLGAVNGFLQHPNYPADSFSGPPLRIPLVPGERGKVFREPHAAGLSMWHLLFAIEGFDICIPEKRMRLAPNLPADVGPVKLPLFLPSCLGTIEFKQEAVPKYQQTVVLTFDSPMAVETVELRIPGHVTHVDVKCASAEGDLVPEFETESWRDSRLVRIQFNSSAQGTKQLKFLVTETEEKKEISKPKPKEGWLRRLLPGT